MKYYSFYISIEFVTKLPKLEGEGGMIGVDAAGNVTMIFNSAGMYRGMKSSDGSGFVQIYQDDPTLQ